MLQPDDRLLIVSDLELLGVGRRSMTRSAAAGGHRRLRPGVYVESANWDACSHDEQHLLRMRALAHASGGDAVFSHWSAATAHGLPLLRHAADEVDVTVGAHASRGLVGVRGHLLALDHEDVVHIQGLACTSLARTAIDIAAAAPFPEAVVVADAVLHRLHAFGPDAAAVLADAARRALPRRAHKKIDRVLAFADGRSESPGESLSRVTMRALRVPPPELQHEIWDANGLAGRLDFWFPAHRVAGEMDGRAKYLDPLLNRGDAARVVYDEKLREDRIRLQGIRFVRWGWDVARSPALLGARLAAVGVVPSDASVRARD